jgi:hypothetical protein
MTEMERLIDECDLDIRVRMGGYMNLVHAWNHLWEDDEELDEAIDLINELLREFERNFDGY